MVPRYDVFKLVDGAAVWTGTANSPDELREQFRHLVTDSVRECWVLDRLTGHKRVVTPEQVERNIGQRAKTPSEFRHS
jgi:hypothetical protein